MTGQQRPRRAWLDGRYWWLASRQMLALRPPITRGFFATDCSSMCLPQLDSPRGNHRLAAPVLCLLTTVPPAGVQMTITNARQGRADSCQGENHDLAGQNPLDSVTYSARP
jgi:hypothetical protein